MYFVEILVTQPYTRFLQVVVLPFQDMFHFSGKISFYTHPPERKENEEHESSQVVQYLGAGFDLVR